MLEWYSDALFMNYQWFRWVQNDVLSDFGWVVVEQDDILGCGCEGVYYVWSVRGRNRVRCGAFSEEYSWSILWLNNAFTRDSLCGLCHRNLMESGEICGENLVNPVSSGCRDRSVSAMFGCIIRHETTESFSFDFRPGFREQRFWRNPCRIQQWQNSEKMSLFLPKVP